MMIEDREETLKKTILELDCIRDRKVLNVGFGRGELDGYLSDFAKSIVAIEKDKELVDLAIKTRKKENIFYQLGKAQKLEFPDDSFDSIVFIKSLHHIPIKDQYTALLEARRVLKENGLLLIIEPIYKGGSYEEIASIFHDEKEAREHAKKVIDKAIKSNLFTKEIEKTFEVEYICKDFEDFFESAIKPKKWIEWKDTFKPKVIEIMQRNKTGEGYILNYKLRLYLLRKN